MFKLYIKIKNKINLNKYKTSIVRKEQFNAAHRLENQNSSTVTSFFGRQFKNVEKIRELQTYIYGNQS